MLLHLLRFVEAFTEFVGVRLGPKWGAAMLRGDFGRSTSQVACLEASVNSRN
jgi:hypothetical protein